MSEEGAYMVFCMELYRREKRLTGTQVAELFAHYSVYDYIRKYFGSFHTMSEKLVFQDIDAYIARQGAIEGAIRRTAGKKPVGVVFAQRQP